MGKFLKECFLQKTNQFDALDVWKNLDIGVGLCISRDEKGNVVATMKDSNKILGLISKEDSMSMGPYLEAGWGKDSEAEKKLYYGTISRIVKMADEDKRIKVAVFIRDRE